MILITVSLKKEKKKKLRPNDAIKSKIPLFRGLLELSDVILFIPIRPPMCCLVKLNDGTNEGTALTWEP